MFIFECGSYSGKENTKYNVNNTVKLLGTLIIST